jgi:hypothetical protein
MLARIASLLLPPVMDDWDDRWTLTPEDDLAGAEYLWVMIDRLADRVAAYLAEHDEGDWTDPNSLAGAAADLHDCARLQRYCCRSARLVRTFGDYFDHSTRLRWRSVTTS